MKRFAFISRHQPTREQHDLALRLGIELFIVGDHDAFTVVPDDFDPEGAYDGVIVVHPAAAMRLAPYYEIGIYENASRAAEGERPTFYPVCLHLYDLRS
jgi:fermentation-respiration switch protein FrsA (DUF1100 family)